MTFNQVKWLKFKTLTKFTLILHSGCFIHVNLLPLETTLSATTSNSSQTQLNSEAHSCNTLVGHLLPSINSFPTKNVGWSF